MEISKEQQRYERAQKRVQEERGFYTHLTVFIVINILLLLINSNFSLSNQRWMQWNFYVTPFFWGIGLLVHGLKTFKKFGFFKDWEERKIKELMNDDNF